VTKVSVVTGFRVPPLVVDYNQLWIQAELRGAGNGEEWASRSAAELVSRPHWAKYRTRKGKKRVTAVLEQAAVIARKRQDASMGFLLIPSPTEGAKGMAAPAGACRAYVWIFDDYQAAIIMDMSFLDLAQAARWLPALDDLARDVWLQGDGGPPDGH